MMGPSPVPAPLTLGAIVESKMVVVAAIRMMPRALVCPTLVMIDAKGIFLCRSVVTG